MGTIPRKASPTLKLCPTHISWSVPSFAALQCSSSQHSNYFSLSSRRESTIGEQKEGRDPDVCQNRALADQFDLQAVYLDP